MVFDPSLPEASGDALKIMHGQSERALQQGVTSAAEAPAQAF